MPSVGESMLSAAMVLLYKWINRSGWGSQNQRDLAPQSLLGRDFPRLSWLARSLTHTHPTSPRLPGCNSERCILPGMKRGSRPSGGSQFVPSNLSSPPFISPVKQDPSS